MLNQRLRQVPGALAIALGLTAAASVHGASHREAPVIAFDAAADNTDVYAFVSYDERNTRRKVRDRRATFVLNVNPGQDPADGPNYFSFADDVTYRIHVDNNADGRADDVVYEFDFKTETRPAGGALTGPIPAIGNPNIEVAGLQGITALDGPGSEGLTRRQTYSVTEIRKGHRRTLFRHQPLVAVPSNVGPATMPDYEGLAAQGVYQDGQVRVFAGQRAETFYIDLGAVFDTVNLRRPVPALTAEEDANDHRNPFGVNRFSGTNVSTIAIEVPTTRITADRYDASRTRYPVIGVYASTSRPRVTLRGRNGQVRNFGRPVQVSRMANPLINELLIDTPLKDRWNATRPADERRFLPQYLAPTVATELNLIFGLPVPETPRTDLASLLLKYPGQTLDGERCGHPCAELLRLDLRVDPTPAAEQKRLGAALTDDGAGYPNGRRPNDDVTDIVTRVVGGETFIGARVGDGVNFLEDAPGAGTSDGPGYGAAKGNRLDVTDNGIAAEFPFLPTPHDGRNRQHIDCDEQGANPCQ